MALWFSLLCRSGCYYTLLMQVAPGFSLWPPPCSQFIMWSAWLGSAWTQYKMHYSNWMLLDLPCRATGRAACLSDPTWPLNPAVKQLQPKARRALLQGGPAGPQITDSVCMDESAAEPRISRVPLPYFFLCVSISPGMCAASHFQMVDFEIWLFFPSWVATSPQTWHYIWRGTLNVNKNRVKSVHIISYDVRHDPSQACTRPREKHFLITTVSNVLRYLEMTSYDYT